jgi:hypothetical protein
LRYLEEVKTPGNSTKKLLYLGLYGPSQIRVTAKGAGTARIASYHSHPASPAQCVCLSPVLRQSLIRYCESFDEQVPCISENTLRAIADSARFSACPALQGQNKIARGKTSVA